MGTMSPEKALEWDLFLESESYEEYIMKCDLSGLDEFKCSREEFDRFHVDKPEKSGIMAT